MLISCCEKGEGLNLENGGEKAELQRHSQLRLERKITCLCAHKEGGDESEIKKRSSNRERERESSVIFSEIGEGTKLQRH
jgi:hypothetical protein